MLSTILLAIIKDVFTFTLKALESCIKERLHNTQLPWSKTAAQTMVTWNLCYVL